MKDFYKYVLFLKKACSSYWVLEITTKTDICQEIDVYKNMGVQIKTFVFFDLETTGMFEGTVAPKITEMALIAVARESICNNNQNPLPRILHKLVLPVNPKKIIPVKVQYMTSEFYLCIYIHLLCLYKVIEK